MPDRPDEQEPTSPRGPLVPLPETEAALDELSDLDEPDVAQLLNDLSTRFTAIVPELVGLSVGLVRHDVTFTLVASDDTSASLDAVQYVDGGPCLTAAEEGEQVHAVSSDPLDEQRWGMFPRAAATDGVASSLSIPLHHGGEVVGGVNLYASTQAAFDGHHEEIARVVGGRATEVVTNADLSFSTRLEAAAAPERLREQARIDTALGLIAAKRGISIDEAQRHLSQAAARAGVTEAVVAQVVMLIHSQADPGNGAS